MRNCTLKGRLGVLELGIKASSLGIREGQVVRNADGPQASSPKAQITKNRYGRLKPETVQCSSRVVIQTGMYSLLCH